MGHRKKNIYKALATATFLAISIVPALALPTTYAPNTAEQYLLAAANRDRALHGLPALHLDPVLTQAALYHAREMAAHGDISHQFPGEPDLMVRGASAGAHFSLITENVAEAPESTMIHNLWMRSPGHRANLLDPEVDSIGVSVVVRGHEFYAVEDFANTVATLSFSDQESTIADLITKTGLQVVNGNSSSENISIEDARKTCGMITGYIGQRKPWYILRFSTDKLDHLPEELQSRLSSGEYHQAIVGACADSDPSPFTGYNIAVLLYP